MELIKNLGAVASDIGAVIALAVVLCKPLRQRFLTDAAVRAGQQCLLRGRILSIYYRNLERKNLRQYEYEDLCHCFSAYKALGGNSFAQHIFEEMQDWPVMP